MATKLEDWRSRHPAYDDVPDLELIQGMHKAYFPEHRMTDVMRVMGVEMPEDSSVGIASPKGMATRALEAITPDFQQRSPVEEQELGSIVGEGIPKRRRVTVKPATRPGKFEAIEEQELGSIVGEGIVRPQTDEQSRLSEENQVYLENRDFLQDSWNTLKAVMAQGQIADVAVQLEQARKPVPQAHPIIGPRQEEIDRRRAESIADAQEDLAEGVQELQEIGQVELVRPSTEAALNAKNTKHFFQMMMVDPIGFIYDINLVSAPHSVKVAIASGLMRMVMGPGGFVGGTGAGSYKAEYANEFLQGLMENNVDVTDFESIRSALDNEELVEELKERARNKAAFVGAADGVGAAVLFKNLGFGKGLAKNTLNTFNQLLVQMGTGAGGEAAGSLAATGEISIGQALAEGIGELGSGLFELGTVALTGIREKQKEWSEVLSKEVAEGNLTRGEAEVELIRGLRLEARKQIIDAGKGVEETEAALAQMDNVFEQKEKEALDTYFGEGTFERIESTNASGISQRETLDKVYPSRTEKGSLITTPVERGEVRLQAAPNYDRQIESLTSLIDQGERQLRQAEGINRDNILANITNLQDRREEVRGQKSNYEELIQLARRNLEEWSRIYTPRNSYYVQTSERFAKDARVSPDGYAFHWDLLQNSGDNVSIIGFNPSKFVGPQGVIKGLFTEALAHEFTHSLAASRLRELRRNNPAAYKGLKGDYYNFLRASAKKDSYGNFLKRYVGPFQRPRYQHAVDAINQLPNDYLTYLLSFEEWFAQMGMKAITRRDVLPAELQSLKNVFERFYRRFGEDWPSSEGVDTFFDNMAYRTIVEKQEGNALPQQQSEVERRVDKLLDFAKVPTGVKVEVREDQAKLSRFGKFVLTLTQITKNNPEIGELQEYTEATRKWWKTKTFWYNEASQTINSMRDLPKRQRDSFWGVHLQGTQISALLGRRLTLEELKGNFTTEDMRVGGREMPFLVKKLRQYAGALDDRGWRLVEQVQNDFRSALGYDPAVRKSGHGGLYQVAQAEIRRNFADLDKVELDAKLAELDGEFRTLDNRTFFPFARFGKHTIKVTAKKDFEHEGRRFAAGNMVEFQTERTPDGAKKLAKELEKKYSGKVMVGIGRLDDTVSTFVGMPQVMVRMLKDKLELTSEQRQQLDDLIQAHSPAHSFKKHLLERKGIRGFSDDGLRVFSAYFMHFANHMARLDVGYQLDAATNKLGQRLRKATDTGRQDTIGTGNLLEFLQKHKDYLFNPGNELSHLRAYGFIHFLGMVPKSAWVNLTQVPMVAYPHLAARKELGGSGRWNPGLGDARAFGALTRAMTDITDLRVRGKQKKFSADEERMFVDLKDILDESLATELAGLAEGRILQRALSGWGGRYWHNTLAVTTYLFQAAEKYNREIVALAAYRMGRKQGLSHAGAVKEADLAVESSQFEYARWNRPQFMRGKFSPVFLFWSYLQNQLYFTAKNPGNIRHLLLLMGVAGVSGLPGAEDALSIIDFIKRIAGKQLDIKDPQKEVAQYIRDTAIAFDLDPDMVLYGGARYWGLGPVHMFDGLTIPMDWANANDLEVKIPNVDLSQSIGMGNVVPLLPLVTSLDKGEGQGLSDAMRESRVALLSGMMGIYEAISSDEPNAIRRWESAMPIAVKNGMQMSRLMPDSEGKGGYKGNKDAMLVELDWRDAPWTSTFRALLKGMGFQETEISQVRERNWAQKEAVNYWNHRRKVIFQARNYAIVTKDQEAIKDATDAWRKFNRQVPFRSMAIQGDDLRDSLVRYLKNRTYEEQNLPIQRRYIPLQREIRERFPITAEEKVEE